MAKYFKPHKRIIKDPPNADVSVSSSWMAGRYPYKYNGYPNIFRLMLNVEQPEEEGHQTHVVELTRDEMTTLLGQIQNALNVKL